LKRTGFDDVGAQPPAPTDSNPADANSDTRFPDDRALAPLGFPANPD